MARGDGVPNGAGTATDAVRGDAGLAGAAGDEGGAADGWGIKTVMGSSQGGSKYPSMIMMVVIILSNKRV